MKKKVLLLASLATLVVGGSVAAGVVFGQGESNFKGVVATAKEFTFTKVLLNFCLNASNLDIYKSLPYLIVSLHNI